MEESAHVPRVVRHDLRHALVAFVVMVAAVVAVRAAASAGVVRGSLAGSLSAYLAVWIPLLAAVVIARASRGGRPFFSLTLLRVTPLDAVWALAIALLARAADAGIVYAFFGRTGLGGQVVLDAGAVDVRTIVIGLVAPVIVAPVVEELFFRGLLLRALDSEFRVAWSRVQAAVIAVAIASVLFALPHLLVASNPLSATVTGLSTFIFGAAVGALAISTGRIGGAIIAHVAFNGIAVAASWPW